MAVLGGQSKEGDTGLGPKSQGLEEQVDENPPQGERDIMGGQS